MWTNSKSNIFYITRGNYLFPPWTTKKCAIPPWTTNSTKIEHSTTKDNHFPPSVSHTPFYPHFLPLFPLWTTTIFLFFPHELPSSSNMPPYKTAHDPLTVCFNPFDWRKGEKWLSLVVECSILVELVVHGGIAHFLVVHGGKR